MENFIVKTPKDILVQDGDALYWSHPHHCPSGEEWGWVQPGEAHPTEWVWHNFGRGEND